MTRRGWWLLGSLALTALVAGNWWSARTLDRDAPTIEPSDGRIDYALTDFRAEFFDAAGASLRVSGPRLTHGAADREVLIDAPRFEFGNADDVWRGRAGRARIDRNESRLTLRDDVVIRHRHRRGPVTIRSERVVYDRDAATVHSPVPARVRQNGTELSGGTLTVWVDDERMEFLQDAHAIYRRDDAAGGG